jgi:hypothetical protein
MIPMRLPRRLVHLLVVAAVFAAALLALGPVSPAYADPPICPPNDRQCTIEDSDPGNPGGGGGGDGGTNPTSCYADGPYGQVQVACYDEDFGSYVGGGCWLRPAPENTNPPPEGGKVPGGWYTRTCIDAGDETGTYIWIGAEDVPALTPEQLARRALASIRLLPADIRIAPDPAGSGLVGLPVWMWTTVNANTWGPITASDSDRGLTVNISAQAVSIAWSMGDGGRVNCDNPGTPYEAEFGNRRSPDCGYDRYNTPGVYQVTATTTWRVTWAGGGQSGVITVVRQSQTTVRIGELQVVAE